MPSKQPIQANLTSNCPPLPGVQAKDLGELVIYTTQIIDLYGDCRDKHNTLVKTLK